MIAVHTQGTTRITFCATCNNHTRAARIHHQWMPDKLRLENGISPDTIRLLQQMGHTLEVSGRTTGRTNSIMLRDGWLLGATDTRRPGGWVAAY